MDALHTLDMILNHVAVLFEYDCADDIAVLTDRYGGIGSCNKGTVRRVIVVYPVVSLDQRVDYDVDDVID